MEDEKKLNESVEEAAAEAVEEAEEKAEEVIEAAEQKAEDAAEAVEEKAEDAAEAAEEKAEDVAEAVEEQAEDAAEAVEETAEEVTEAAVEKAEEAEETAESSTIFQTVKDKVGDIAEGAIDKAEDAAGVVKDQFGNVTENIGEGVSDLKEKAKNNKIIFIAAAVALVVVIAIACIFLLPKLFGGNKNNNPYEGYVNSNNAKTTYLDTSGRTVGEVADDSGIEYSEFLKQYDLPEDMPRETNENAAYNNIPVGKMLEMNHFEDMETVEAFKEELGLPDWVNENTTWGEALGEAPLKNYAGEENVEDFKTRYNLGDDVTGDTPYKDVRRAVEEVLVAEREESERQMEELRKQIEQQSAEQQDEQSEDNQNVEQTEAAAN